MATLLSRPAAPLFGSKAPSAPRGAVPLAGPPDQRPQPHWHLIGNYFRPVHEQIAALNDSRRWAAVVAAGSARGPLTATGLALRCEGMTLTTVQRGSEYALIDIAGDVDGSATQQVRCQIRALLDNGAQHLVINLSDLLSCDGRLGLLLSRAQLRMRARRGQLEVIGTPAPVQPYLRVGRLPESFTDCDTYSRPDNYVPRLS